jgi:hypothetical protein
MRKVPATPATAHTHAALKFRSKTTSRIFDAGGRPFEKLARREAHFDGGPAGGLSQAAGLKRLHGVGVVPAEEFSPHNPKSGVMVDWAFHAAWRDMIPVFFFGGVLKSPPIGQ